MRRTLITGSVAAATVGLVAGGLTYASRYPTSQIFGRVLLAGNDSRQLALTFDDGPNPRITPRLLELLARHDVRATFFLIGTFVRQQPALARALADAGHLLGNHTMTHPHLATQTRHRIQEELHDTSRLIEDVTGAPVRYFRPPHGSRRPFVLRAARDLGLTTVLWNVTASDWNPIGPHAIQSNVERGIERNRRRGRGSNILLHDGGHKEPTADRQDTLAATARILAQHLPASFVTVDAWN